MNFVTKIPIIHWLFPSKILSKAYFEIIKARGDDAYWYMPEIKELDWAKLNVGIGINGTIFSKFINICKKIKFNKVQILPTPIFSVGKKSMKHKVLKNFSIMFKPVVKIPLIREFLSHRIVCVIQK